jgi:biogenesis of lysosome-related organelles complex 1 subunit 2
MSTQKVKHFMTEVPEDSPVPAPPPAALSLDAAAAALTGDVAAFTQLQTQQFADVFGFVQKLNLATEQRYSEIIQEAGTLRDKAKGLQEQEIGVASFLSNLAVTGTDIGHLEEAIAKLESYCTILEQKAAKLK